MLVNASGPPDVGSVGTGGNEVASPPTVRAEIGVCPATTFLIGEGAVASTAAIQVHAVVCCGGGSLAGGESRWEAERLGGRVGTGEGSGKRQAQGRQAQGRLGR